MSRIKLKPSKSIANTACISIGIAKMAPLNDAATDYDRRHLGLYAALLDADRAGQAWQDAACDILRLDVATPCAEACWRSHLDRAHWIVGEGLASALSAFNSRTVLIRSE